MSSCDVRARGRGNTVAGQGINIEILLPEGRIKYLGQLITFKYAVQVVWATSTSHRQERHQYASGTWTMTEEMEKKLHTTRRRMKRMIKKTQRKTGRGHAAAHAASVDNTADVEPRGLTSAEDSLKRDVMESDFLGSKLKQPTRPTTPITTTTATKY